MKKTIFSLSGKGLAFLLTAALAGCSASSPGACAEETEVTQKIPMAETIAQGAILHAFSWDFKTIRNSLPDIAAAGFRAVQTSPVNAVLEGEDGGMQLFGDGKWYYHYQPTDWTVGNYQLGTEEEFKEMTAEAEKYGIAVIVDVAPNHTTPVKEAVSENLIEAAGGPDSLYHDNSGFGISNTSDREQLTMYEMGGLPDVDTENPGFQDYFLKYLDQVIEDGADGFRFDTAKHIALPDDPETGGRENTFWPKVMSELHEKGIDFSYGEVLQGGNDRIDAYIDMIGAATASSYGEKIRNALQLGNLNPGSLMDFSARGKEETVTWVESHDNYINDGTWKELSEQQVELGYAILAAQKDGTPLFFDRPYSSSIEDKWGENRIGASGSDFYKSNIVRAVNFFRTAMENEDENMSNPEGDSSALLIERGQKGLVIVNLKRDLETGFEVQLADGCYIDRVSQERYLVKNGRLTREDGKPIAADSAIVLYNDGYVRTPVPAQLAVENAEFVHAGETEELTLKLENADEATWALTCGNETLTGDFQKEGTVQISQPENSEAVLNVQAVSTDGVPMNKELYFVRETVSEAKTGDELVFEKPESWGSTVHVYIYSDQYSDTWPGETMNEKDGKYTYIFDRDWENPLIIFSSGSEQYPAANEPGLPYEKGKIYSVE